MKVWIDLDGVVADFVGNVMRVAADVYPSIEFPKNYQPRDWDFTDIFTKGDWDAIWKHIKTIPDFWQRASPLEPNASDLRTWLRKSADGHQIFYITSRMDTGGVSACTQSGHWLMHHDLYPFTARLIVVSGPEKKAEAIAENRIDFGIDDYAPTVAGLNMLTQHRCYLLSRPWNRGANQTSVSSLQEFLEIVDSASAHPEGT